MRNKCLSFVGVLFVALFLRLYQLGGLPSGLTWDEAAIGYNAYSIATVHRDEWLKRTPIVFQSFGDYKSPLLIYLTSIILLVAPLTPLIVRLPIALSGVGLVIVTYYITREIFYKEKQRHLISLSAMFLVAISPWAIVYSRVAFESMLSAFLFTLGILSWLVGIRQFDEKREKHGWIAWSMTAISLSLSLYAYHSAKVVVPLGILVLGFVFRTQVLRQKFLVLIGIGLTTLLLLPLLYTSIFGQANSRAVSTTIFGTPDAVLTFVKHYVTHLSPSFLLSGADNNYRQSTMEMGVLYPLELTLAVVGIGAVVVNKKLRKFIWIPLLFFVGLIPASLGIDVPHSNRAVLAMPWIQITASIGWMVVLRHVNTGKRAYTHIAAACFFIFFSLHVSTFVRTYLRVYNTTLPLKAFGYGLEEAISYTRSQESSVDRVYFTNDFSQAYIYLVFFKRMNPIDFRGGGLANYVITENPYNDAKGHSRVLIVGTRDDIPETIPPEKVITYPDGSQAFVIIRQ